MSDQAIRIVVLLKRLQPAPPATGDDALLGGCERAALRLALRLKSELHGTLTAVALGSFERELPVLGAALGAGCDRAVCVSSTSEEIAADKLDYLGIAEILAEALHRLGCDILLCGDRSQEELQGAVGPAIAELLHMRHLSSVASVASAASVADVASAEAGREPGTVVAECRAGGALHRFRCTPPMVLCVLAATSEPPGPLNAAKPDAPAVPENVDHSRVERMELADLGRDPSAPGRSALGQVRPPRTSQRGAILASEAELVSRLIDDHLLR